MKQKDIKKDTKKAINRLRELLIRDCDKDWFLGMYPDTIYLSGGWEADDVEYETKLPLMS
jgi:hypothetical protein